MNILWSHRWLREERGKEIIPDRSGNGSKPDLALLWRWRPVWSQCKGSTTGDRRGVWSVSHTSPNWLRKRKFPSRQPQICVPQSTVSPSPPPCHPRAGVLLKQQAGKKCHPNGKLGTISSAVLSRAWSQRARRARATLAVFPRISTSGKPVLAGVSHRGCVNKWRSPELLKPWCSAGVASKEKVMSLWLVRHSRGQAAADTEQTGTASSDGWKWGLKIQTQCLSFLFFFLSWFLPDSLVSPCYVK